MCAHKTGLRPKIKILIERSGFRSLRGPTCQISWSYDFKPRRLRGADRQTDKQTNRQTDRQTDNANYYVDIARFYRFERMYFHFNAKGYFNVYILSDCPPLSHRHEQTTQL